MFLSHFFACLWYYVGRVAVENGEFSWLHKDNLVES